MKVRFERNRTSNFIIMYSFYLYFLGLSLCNTSKTLLIFRDEKRIYVSIWNWIQRSAEYSIYKRKRLSDSKFLQVLETAEEKYNKYFSMFKELARKNKIFNSLIIIIFFYFLVLLVLFVPE
jgi:hypothetical protein